jgi:hypothetical protein
MLVCSSAIGNERQEIKTLSKLQFSTPIQETISGNESPNVFRPVENWVKRLFGMKRKKFSCGLGSQVNDLELSQTEIIAACPLTNNSCANDRQQIIEVKTTAVEIENAKYVYTISGGKIIGSGRNVFWDLTGAEPGIYKITAGVDDGLGVIGATQTRQVKIVECADCK